MINISVICPILNEEKYIKGCIESLLKQDYPIGQLEIIFIDGYSSDNTLKIIQSYTKKYGFIKLLYNPAKYVPAALNIGIKNSSGEYIARIDAHSSYPSNYLSKLYSLSKKLDADNIGGIFNTKPCNSTTIADNIAYSLSSRFGMGNAYFRTGINNIKKVDTVPFGFFKRTIFDKIGLFDEDLIRNQDDEFNNRIIKHGGNIYLSPDIIIDYYPRDSIKKICSMFYQYGLFKPLVNFKLKKITSFRQLIPPIFVLGLILGLILSFISSIFLYLYIGCIFIYFFLTLLVTIKAHFKNKKNYIFLPLIFLCIHLSYGSGYLIGIMKIIFNKKFHVKNKR
ncbi:WblJ protein [Photorhabdus luminescens subsp. luminescens]|uniref:Glycosyltransferase, catalytic subunit of cellulose synthase and poly-beta-1,6-N-acetylglucosamine synthase n=1 Tax=Photorhabdus luminescens TaxID=29488 RepID=A0A1G5RJA0_PHOLU|nr:glycosyltransferase family 2 protein [Photorhabdus luminescens]KMW71697.1 WblJ protein [Photorhabdus luminescens subsp. luminescens]SCZ74117.1 Glycosyltransferase, catalytic subunit of cellulose synthase and poly-beta-1,6-N-acetylglucosamine synthase [Photorhabdus luminescens]